MLAMGKTAVTYKFVAYLKNDKGTVDVQLWMQDFRHHGDVNAGFLDRHIAKVFAIASEHQHLTHMPALANLYPYEASEC